MEPRSKSENIKKTAEDVADDLRDVTEQAHHRLSELWDVSREKATLCARATDEKIRANPYQTIGIAFGVGLLIGVLINRRGSSEDY